MGNRPTQVKYDTKQQILLNELGVAEKISKKMNGDIRDMLDLPAELTEIVCEFLKCGENECKNISIHEYRICRECWALKQFELYGLMYDARTILLRN